MLGLSLLFVFGFSTVFIILGASATTLGQLLLHYRYETNIVGGAIIFIFGLFMLGLLHLSLLQRDLQFHLNTSDRRLCPWACLRVRLAPCIGPVLGAILAVRAASATVSDGVVLLAVYSLGLGLPFLIAAVFTGAFLPRMRVMCRLGRPVQLFAGGVMVLMGVAMIPGYISPFPSGS